MASGGVVGIAETVDFSAYSFFDKEASVAVLALPNATKFHTVGIAVPSIGNHTVTSLEYIPRITASAQAIGNVDGST